MTRTKELAPVMPMFRSPCVNCGEDAIAWIRGGNVCHAHYVALFRADDARHSRENNLRTPAEKVSYIKHMLAQPKNPREWMLNPKSQRASEMAAEVNRYTMSLEPYVEREPGCDDE